MKKRLIAIVLAMAIVLSGFVMPEHAEAKENNRFFLGAMGKNPVSRMYMNESMREIVRNAGMYEYKSSRQDFPSRFDLREHGLVTPVKNQNPYGTCWLFSSVSSIESNALMMGLGEYDISEYHLGYFSTHILEGQDPSIEGEGLQIDGKWYDYGGDTIYVVTTLMKGYGPASEEMFPYKDIKNPLTIEAASQYNLMSFNGCYVLQGNDIDSIKEALTRNGVVEASICAGSWEDKKIFNQKTNAAYLPEITDKYNQIDHGVSIVGWDDNYSKENFATQPEKDGAWIVKNSWGTDWGDNGYLYVSYYDALMSACSMFSFTMSPLNTYDGIYQYDGGPAWECFGDVRAVAIAVEAKDDETLTMIAIDPGDNYDFNDDDYVAIPFEPVDATIEIYINVDDEEAIDEGKSIYSQRIHLEHGGYQKVDYGNGVDDVSNLLYGGLIGIDFPFLMSNETMLVPTFFAGYSGSKQEYQSVVLHNDSLVAGGMLTLKNYFALLSAQIYITNGPETYRLKQYHDAFNVFSCTATVKGELDINLSENMVFQPAFTFFYNHSSLQDYKTVNGASISSNNFHNVVLSPSAKLMASVNGWYPYLSGSINISTIQTGSVTADGVKLAKYELPNYVEGSIGIENTFYKDYSGYFQVSGYAGDMRGFSFQMGLRGYLD